jgi:hypothetical protein
VLIVRVREAPSPAPPPLLPCRSRARLLKLPAIFFFARYVTGIFLKKIGDFFIIIWTVLD